MTATPIAVDTATEWLETDGLGGFASGTTSGLRTRRYHALLLAAARPPADRRVLVSSFVARLELPEGAVELWPQVYTGGWYTGRDALHVEFAIEPWPRWCFHTRFGVRVHVELFVVHGSPTTVLTVRLERRVPGARLALRPLLSGRDFHALHRENPHFRWEVEERGALLRFQPYPDVPGVLSLSNATFTRAPDWYRRFHYAEEAARGLDAEEDLASPGVLTFDLEREEACWVVQADLPGAFVLDGADVPAFVEVLRSRERKRRARFPTLLDRAADAYVVQRGRGRTIIAGYPWFGDWGRDTFIALRGLCFATGNFDTARAILGAWTDAVSDGLLPNRFPDAAGDAVEYNSIDAALWFVLVANELMDHPRARGVLSDAERRRLTEATVAIVRGLARGTRYGIRKDADGLLVAGAPGVQLTWMDAKVGDYVVTPRAGKPVEIEALWLHALAVTTRHAPEIGAWLESARNTFERRFWNADREMLFDVIDDHHAPGGVDAACRPNQIFAAGGLPTTWLSAERVRLVVAAVERELWTPLGLRSLERAHPAYAPRYAGGVAARDGAYHQGTVWPWLLGPFVEAWVKSRGNTTNAKRAARERFLAPLEAHLLTAGVGHVSEIADAEPPHTPRGCPFQAWSVAELLRLDRVVLA